MSLLSIAIIYLVVLQESMGSQFDKLKGVNQRWMLSVVVNETEQATALACHIALHNSFGGAIKNTC